MAPVFASPDIAALVAAFPPPLPVKDRPSLVKSYSGNDLLDSRKVLARFRGLLETSAGRVKRSDLPARLGIENIDWLFDCYDDDVCYSKGLQYLIPAKEVNELVERLKIQTKEAFVDVASFVSDYDLSRQSCERLLTSDNEFCRFPLLGGREIVASHVLVGRIKEDISSTIAGANGEKIDLTTAYGSAPTLVLRTLAEEALEHHGGNGSLETEGDRIVYVPDEFQSFQQKRLAELRQSKVASAVNDLEIDGYCDITANDSSLNSGSQDAQDSNSIAADVMSQFLEQHAGVDLVSFYQQKGGVKSQSSVVATRLAVDKAMTELDTIITALVQDTRQKGDTSASLETLESALCDETSYLGLTKRLLRSGEHRKTLEGSISSAVKAAESQESQVFEDVCREALVAPLELYARGLKGVADQALSERSSQYICDHFRTELMPQLMQNLRNANVLHDKARAKESDKLATACDHSKSVADLQSAVSKFCRKQKIALPDTEQLDATKRRALREKLKGMHKMSRGSDVLQNLIWILLAETLDGLYLSAGKDTSKMIKMYQSVGDEQRGRELERWRDALKAGTQSKEDVQQMKAVAAEAVERVCGTDETGRDV